MNSLHKRAVSQFLLYIRHNLSQLYGAWSHQWNSNVYVCVCVCIKLYYIVILKVNCEATRVECLSFEHPQKKKKETTLGNSQRIGPFFSIAVLRRLKCSETRAPKIIKLFCPEENQFYRRRRDSPVVSERVAFASNKNQVLEALFRVLYRVFPLTPRLFLRRESAQQAAAVAMMIQWKLDVKDVQICAGST